MTVIHFVCLFSRVHTTGAERREASTVNSAVAAALLESVDSAADSELTLSYLCDTTLSLNVYAF